MIHCDGIDTTHLRVITAILYDDTELFKQISENEGFRRLLTYTVFGLTYESLEQ